MVSGNWRIGRKLFAAFALLTVTTVGLSGVIVANLLDIGAAVRSNSVTFEALDRADRVLLDMVNQETGLRGYLIGGDDRFLEPFHAGMDDFARDLATLRALCADNPAQSARLNRIEQLAADWKTDVAEVEIRLMGDPATRDRARAMEASGAGKAAMDQFRETHRQFDGIERAVLAEGIATQHHASIVALWVAVIGSSLVACLAVGFGWGLFTSIARPLAAMTVSMRSLAAGNLTTVVPAMDRRDEVGEMAGAVQVFKDAAIEKARLEAEAAQSRAAADTERARRAAEDADRAQRQQAVMGALAAGLGRMAGGDLVRRLEEPFATEYEAVRGDFNAALDQLRAAMSEVAAKTVAIDGSAAEIGSAADDLARRTEQQAASLEETAAALEQITATVRRTAEGSAEARQTTQGASEMASRSSEVVDRAVAAMGGIEKSSAEIGQIIGVIDEIAFQTNLLALNAGVEAARAGDAGRGFAVVASEVRALAQRSADAARQIKTLIHSSGSQVRAGVKLVDEAGVALRRIAEQITAINGTVAEIAAGCQEQASGLGQVNTAVTQLDQATQQNAAMVEETTAAVRSLGRDTAGLAELLGRFRTGENRLPGPGKPASYRAGVEQLARQAATAGRGYQPSPREAEAWDEF